jgi:hypothetical protein
MRLNEGDWRIGHAQKDREAQKMGQSASFTPRIHHFGRNGTRSQLISQTLYRLTTLPFTRSMNDRRFSHAGCPIPRVPGPSSRDRYSSLRRSNAKVPGRADIIYL